MKDGFVINLQVKRANGTVDDYGEFHNVMLPDGFNFLPLLTNSGGGTLNCFVTTNTTRIKNAASGTFSQAGTTITRQSGTFDLNTLFNGAGMRFGTGEFSYKTANINSSSCTVSKSQIVATTTLDYYAWTNANNNIGQAGAGFFPHTRTYSNGVITWTAGSSYSLPVNPGAAYSMTRITYRWPQPSGSLTDGSAFDLPIAITVNTGDQVVITSSIVRATWDAYAPRVFAASPIVGYTGSGKTQRLLRATDNDSVTNARIYLVSDANKLIPLPNMPGPADPYVTVASLTKIETITPSVASLVGPGYGNNYFGGMDIVGTVVTGGTVKQIFYGDTTNMWGVVEYDTPIVVAPGEIITLNPRIERLPVL